MDKEYWNNYYKIHKNPGSPSPFAIYSQKFIPEKDGTYYQFMVVANYSSPLSTIGTFKIEQVKLKEEVK